MIPESFVSSIDEKALGDEREGISLSDVEDCDFRPVFKQETKMYPKGHSVAATFPVDDDESDFILVDEPVATCRDSSSLQPRLQTQGASVHCSAPRTRERSQPPI